MDGHKHQKFDDEQLYDGALQQITPAPEHFVPQGTLNLGGREEITIRRKPHRSRGLAGILYFFLQGLIFFGLFLNYNLFGGLADLALWVLTIITYIAYF